jgi:FkbM family methyltransferase
MNNKLIFDIGLHKGEDASYYLRSGYKVIGVEASPVLSKACAQKFKKYIDENNLVIENKGISGTTGILKFWINHKFTEWSSFEKELGCRNNTACHSVDIECVNMNYLFQKYGIPYYLKIDIEGNDGYCLEGIDAINKPKYVSFEASNIDWLKVIRDKGYTKFKLINQHDGFKAFNKKRESSAIRMFRNKVRWRLVKTFGYAKFPCGSSGPFAENTDGDWINFDELVNSLKAFTNNGKPLNEESWFDVHATF